MDMDMEAETSKIEHQQQGNINNSQQSVVMPSVSVETESEQQQQTKLSGHDNGTSFATTMEKLRNCAWYWGPISWEEAEMVLKDRPPGSFLVRDSRNERYIFSLSYRATDSVTHTRLPQHRGKFCFGGPRSHIRSESISEFIEKTMDRSQDGRLHFFMHPKNEQQKAENIRLLHPVSRHSTLPSLKHIARFHILTRLHSPQLISQLPLPPHIHHYLRDPRFIAEIPDYF